MQADLSALFSIGLSYSPMARTMTRVLPLSPNEPPSFSSGAKLWLRGIGAVFILASVAEFAVGWMPYGFLTLYWGAMVASFADLDERNKVMMKHIATFERNPK